MDIFGIVITIIVVIAVIAILRWFVAASGITIPQPLLIVAYAIIAIVAIMFLAQYAGIGVRGPIIR